MICLILWSKAYSFKNESLYSYIVCITKRKTKKFFHKINLVRIVQRCDENNSFEKNSNSNTNLIEMKQVPISFFFDITFLILLR